MRSELTQQELNRLSMSQLIEYGRQALQTQAYERAACLFRESVRRAPFRHDFKEYLAMAIEGTLQENTSNAPRRSASRPAADAPRPQEPLIPDRAPYSSNEEPVQPRPRQNPTPPPMGRPEIRPRPIDSPRANEWRQSNEPPEEPERPFPPSRPVNRPQAPPARPAQGKRPQPPRGGKPASRKPIDFGRRHQRGPLSAILVGGFLGFIVIGVIAAGVWFYMNYSISGALRDTFNTAKFNSIKESVMIARGKEQYSKAIELLKTLPPTLPQRLLLQRNLLLAQIYNDQGEQLFEQNPPSYQGALDAYKQALTFDSLNPKYGMHLGDAYFQLAKERKDNHKAYEDNLDRARQTFEQVLALDPKILKGQEAMQVKALEQLAKIYEIKFDHKAARNALNRIIDLLPDSVEAQRARMTKISLGYR